MPYYKILAQKLRADLPWAIGTKEPDASYLVSHWKRSLSEPCRQAISKVSRNGDSIGTKWTQRLGQPRGGLLSFALAFSLIVPKTWKQTGFWSSTSNLSWRFLRYEGRMFWKHCRSRKVQKSGDCTRIRPEPRSEATADMSHRGQLKLKWQSCKGHWW